MLTAVSVSGMTLLRFEQLKNSLRECVPVNLNWGRHAHVRALEDVPFNLLLTWV